MNRSRSELVERELAAGVLSELDNGDGKLGHQATSDELHALIRGLVDSLPPAGSDWSNEDCANWLQAAAFNLRLIYKGIGTIKVEAAN